MESIGPETAVLVVGGGVTGQAALAALVRLGAQTVLTDDNPSALTSFAQQGVAVIEPGGAAEQISGFGLVVTSPGIPPTAPVLTAAA
ncbi:MAG: UDP-N-acetylmuramoyl-L-alanine--D-glutamate ligase, partial [Actinomycetia bacterium]|nr:UDP-N-acetylmuramoyl-L-alanine--D-glutamate ligase [Actinomycetes bacterium]